MLNPFLNPMPTQQKPKKTVANTDESIAQTFGHSLDTASPRPSMGLLLGKLLIRMGEKLAKEETPLKSTREGA